MDHRFHEAIDCYEQVNTRGNVTRRHGNNDPDHSLDFGLGIAYLAVGRTQEAVRLLERVAGIQQRHRHEDNPKRLLCERVLASAYIDDGQTAKAVDILRHVVKMQNGFLTPEKPGLLESTLLLGSQYNHTQLLLGCYRHLVIVWHWQMSDILIFSAISKTLAKEVAEFGIRVLQMYMGSFDTPMGRSTRLLEQPSIPTTRTAWWARR